MSGNFFFKKAATGCFIVRPTDRVGNWQRVRWERFIQ